MAFNINIPVIAGGIALSAGVGALLGANHKDASPTDDGFSPTEGLGDAALIGTIGVMGGATLGAIYAGLVNTGAMDNTVVPMARSMGGFALLGGAGAAAGLLAYHAFD